MRLIHLALPALLLSVGCSSCGSAASETPPPETISAETEAEPAEAEPGPAEEGPATAIAAPSAEQLQGFAASSNAFAFDLYQKVRGEEGNLAYSPASISLAFAMTYAGARGETATQMKDVLRLPDDANAVHESASRILASWNDPERETYELRVVNRLFGEESYTFVPEFVALTRDRYRAPLQGVSFVSDPEAQREHINGWVMEQTNDRIEDLLPTGSIDDLTRLVLVNAVYFLGKWDHAFDAAATSQQPFYASDGATTEVATMQQTESFAYGEADGVQVLQMPYVGDELAMTVVLPRERNGLTAIESALSQERLDGWLAATSVQRTQVFLPRFELSNARIPLKDALIAMGMELPFDRDRADFTGMAAPPDAADELYISDCFHEAFVKVDEEGTEAAAATAVVMATRGARPSEPAVFRADHPFLFFIRDTTSGAILFVGRVSSLRPRR